jgi:hypothetical protein
MKHLVVDAATCMHWFLPRSSARREADAARRILTDVHHGRISLVQPAVWATMLVGDLIALKLPDAATAAEEILAMHVRFDNGPATLRRAVELASRLDRPLLETIYHATALQNDICLVTADDVYFSHAAHLGNIVHLRDWSWGSHIAEPVGLYTVHPLVFALADATPRPILVSRNARMRPPSALS